MMDGKSLSMAIRKKKKMDMHSDYKPDMDYAGQKGVDPVVAWDEKQAMEVKDALGEPDRMPLSDSEMGEGESSQDTASLKRSMMRIKRYLDELLD